MTLKAKDSAICERAVFFVFNGFKSVSLQELWYKVYVTIKTLGRVDEKRQCYHLKSDTVSLEGRKMREIRGAGATKYSIDCSRLCSKPAPIWCFQTDILGWGDGSESKVLAVLAGRPESGHRSTAIYNATMLSRGNGKQGL